MRMSKRRWCALLTLMVCGAFCGALIGSFLGRIVAFHAAESWLDEYATRVVMMEDDSFAEARDLLVALNASRYDFCSDAEISYFRELVFRSEYLKDAGRLAAGKIACSATSGRQTSALDKFTPGFAQKDGTFVFSNLVPLPNSGLKRAGLQEGSAYVVFGSHEPQRVAPIPLRFTVTMTNAPDLLTRHLGHVVPHIEEAILAMEVVDHQGDTLYATRCSAHNANCVTAYTSAGEALAGERGKITGGIISGGIVGALFGLMLSLIYQRSRSLHQQLHRAIRRNELTLNYQPIVDIEDGRIVGAEALARWSDDHGQVIGPDVFVAIAEERGFVGELTRLVVRRALADFGETLRRRPDFRLNVNVAAADLSDDSFLPMLQDALQQAQVSPQSLAIEITESATARKRKAAGTIAELSRRGHSVHVDDFGTGYSSLAYLNELSVDTIKIDRAFTQAIGTGSVTVCILPQILEMAEVLNLQVIVEGVETAEQAGYFAAGGRPVFAQGWLFGHPVNFDEFRRVLSDSECAEPETAAIA